MSGGFLHRTARLEPVGDVPSHLLGGELDQRIQADCRPELVDVREVEVSHGFFRFVVLGLQEERLRQLPTRSCPTLRRGLDAVRTCGGGLSTGCGDAA